MNATNPLRKSGWTLPATLATLFVVFALTLLAAPKAAAITFTRSVIDANGPASIWGKTVGDLNHDGRPDLIAGGNGSGGLVWYENPTWQKRQIAAGGGFLTDHEVCDVNGDGLNDVISLRAEGIVWYESPLWVPFSIAADTLHDIEVADFDNDGDCDIVGRNQSLGGNGNVLFYYEQVSPYSWLRSTRQIPHGEGLKKADIDSDGRLDIIVNEVWFRNGAADFNSWQEYSYAAGWTHEHAYIDVGDFNGDGHKDIVLAPSEPAGQRYRLSWFEAPDDPLTDSWQEHIVENSIETVLHFVGAGDFNRDGFPDIAVAEMQQGQDPDEISIYINADGEGLTWSKEVLDTIGSHSMRVLDVDGDGDVDLYGANWTDNHVYLWINQTTVALDQWKRHVVDPAKPWRAMFITDADIDNDGWPDIVTGGGGIGIHRTSRRRGNETSSVRRFTTWQLSVISISTGTWTFSEPAGRTLLQTAVLPGPRTMARVFSGFSPI